jgi:hypothetical protein
VNLRRGDVIIGVNDDRILRTRDLEKAASRRAPFWRLTVQRGGQVFQTVVGG